MHMTSKRLFILIVAFIVLGSATVFASDTYSWYRAKTVKVVVNDQALESPGLLISGKNTRLENTTVLPVRELAGTLQALVNWDDKTQTVTIHKPNVHITLLEQKDGALTFFGQVTHKLKPKFHIFTQFDNITTNIHSFQVKIVDPNDRVVHEFEETLKEQRDSIWHGSELIELEFKHLGAYTVQVFMKAAEKDDFALVSEKVIQSIPSK